MKIGICANLLRATAAAAAGFDYIEGEMATVAQASEGDFRQIVAAVAGSGINAESLNIMLPGRFRLTGPQADLKPVKGYLQVGFARAERLGVRVQVFGSGGARNVPEDWPAEKAFEQLSEFLGMASPIAAEHGIAIAIEPLNPRESNIINTVSDALSLARRVRLHNVGVLADWYHMAIQDEGLDGILTSGGMLLHCHIAVPEGRKYPLPNDGADFSALFGALKRIGYEERISIEGNGKESEYTGAVSRLKQCI